MTTLTLIFGHKDAERQLSFQDDGEGAIECMALDIAAALNMSRQFGTVRLVRPSVEVLYDNHHNFDEGGVEIIDEVEPGEKHLIG